MEGTNETWKFEGFFSPNSTQVPDEFFDEVAPRLNGAEVKALLYIIRRTFGFKKQCDNISISQMLNGIIKRNGERLDLGAGLSKSTLLRAIKTLADKDIILPTKQVDFKGGFIATNYRLNIRPLDTETNQNAQASILGLKMGQGGLSQNHTKGMSQNQTKPLVQKRDIQVTVSNRQLDNNGNVAKKASGRNVLHQLPDRDQPQEHTRLIAADILDVLGDRHSEQFYLLVARKLPERFIRTTLSELKEGGAVSPARVFTSKVMEFARTARADTGSADLAAERQALAARFVQSPQRMTKMRFRPTSD